MGGQLFVLPPQSPGEFLKTLLLLRHAKSSWDEPFLSDHERPLARRGQKAAPLMGMFIAEAGLVPDLVLCSSARRAQETWNLASDHIGGPYQVEILDDLYHASVGSLIAMLREVPDALNRVLMVGHNPTFEDLAMTLVGSGSGETERELGRKFPTGALAVIDFPDGGWPEIERGAGYLRDFVKPRSLQP
jgi:phosphohistidine phosphatase